MPSIVLLKNTFITSVYDKEPFTFRKGNCANIDTCVSSTGAVYIPVEWLYKLLASCTSLPSISVVKVLGISKLPATCCVTASPSTILICVT